MKKFCLTVLGLVALMTSCNSVGTLEAAAGAAVIEMQNERQYTAGTSLKNSYFGLHVVVPQGFIAQFKESAGAQVLVFAKTGVGVIAILQQGVNSTEYQRLMAQPFPLSPQLTFQPLGSPIQRGSSLTTAFADAAGLATAKMQAVANANGFSPLLLAFTNAGQQALVDSSLQAVAASFKSVQGLSTSGDAKTRADWQNTLTGRALTTSGGSFDSSVNGTGSTSNDTRLRLCSTGQFEFTRTSSISIGIPNGDGLSSVDKDQAIGRWNLELVSANTAVLVLTDTTGLQRRLLLQVRQNSFLVDGKAFNPNNASGC